MPREDAIEVEGTVTEALPSMIYRVELPNGHRILAHLSAKMRLGATRPEPGDRVRVEMTPYDLSKGCITLKRG